MSKILTAVGVVGFVGGLAWLKAHPSYVALGFTVVTYLIGLAGFIWEALKNRASQG